MSDEETRIREILECDLYRKDDFEQAVVEMLKLIDDSVQEALGDAI